MSYVIHVDPEEHGYVISIQVGTEVRYKGHVCSLAEVAGWVGEYLMRLAREEQSSPQDNWRSKDYEVTARVIFVDDRTREVTAMKTRGTYEPYTFIWPSDKSLPLVNESIAFTVTIDALMRDKRQGKISNPRRIS